MANSTYKHKIGQEVLNDFPDPFLPTEGVNLRTLEAESDTKLDKTANIQAMWTGTQAEYDALTPDANTLYFIQ